MNIDAETEIAGCDEDLVQLRKQLLNETVDRNLQLRLQQEYDDEQKSLTIPTATQTQTQTRRRAYTILHIDYLNVCDVRQLLRETPFTVFFERYYVDNKTDRSRLLCEIFKSHELAFRNFTVFPREFPQVSRFLDHNTSTTTTATLNNWLNNNNRNSSIETQICRLVYLFWDTKSYHLHLWQKFCEQLRELMPHQL